ncbi:MAG: TatD family hydrolase [Verrucomicrobiota bacterium]|nr:TatD family hydrolase [Verrucomicrobiota bacterium]
MRLFDAHNHLQDNRFPDDTASMLAECTEAGLFRMVVNGTRESDWDMVAQLAGQHPQVIPSFGLHPWFVPERSTDWLPRLEQLLDAWPSAVGEIGLDRWKPGLPYDEQEEVFLAQLSLAARRDLPVSIHCLKSWGRLLELLRENRKPDRGFLLHSYGGPDKMVEPLAKLGAYFGFPGYFAHERKKRQREVFRRVPADRLLIETDAPDQTLPENRVTHPLGQGLNHPANIAAVYEAAAETLGQAPESLAKQAEENFLRFFGE